LAISQRADFLSQGVDLADYLAHAFELTLVSTAKEKF
jgi:hypothetical protein